MTDSCTNQPVLTKRWMWFACWIFCSSLLFTRPLIALLHLSLSQDNASYLVLIPLISAWLFYVERDRIFPNSSTDKILGGALLALGGGAALASYFAGGASSQGLQLSGYILSLVLFWAAGFCLLFGRAASKAGSFPLLFLFLMVPIPHFLLDRIIYALQVGSAGITESFFNLFGVPVLRDGLIFHLARVSIEVSQECSGIRSSMALLIVALLVTHFYLRTFWKKILFLASGLFMMILKNGIRIVTLTMLAVYVDPSFLYGRLHHAGGVLFFLLGLLLLWPLLGLLQRGETRPARKTSASVGPSASNVPSV
jgi:exosortase